MGWVISRALMRDFENSRCLQGQEGESSGEKSSGGEQSAPSSETPMPRAYLSSDRTKEFSRLSRSGMTFAPLTEGRGEAMSTWCQEDSHAKTSAQQDEDLGSTAKGPASGVKWRELFKRFDHASSSWRTHRCLFDEVLPESSVILPRWGMMRDGVLSERLTLALRTSENVSGLWPTPCASEGLDCGTNWGSLAAVDKGGRIARRIATNGGPETRQTTHAQLNPAWVEWLMGWPIGWTDLKQLETDRFLQWQRLHGVS
jgi:hypothetical protein